ncbi:hypothetical protein MBANPS3_009183 [Mucor bainieri]
MCRSQQGSSPALMRVPALIHSGASDEQDRLEHSASDEPGTAPRKELQVEHLERILPQLLLDF